MIVDYSKYKPGDTLVFKAGSQTITLTFGEDKQFRDVYGTVYAFQDSSLSADPTVQLGIKNLSIPINAPITEAAIAHDQAYSNPTYQANHSRSEADALLLKQIRELGVGTFWSYLAYPLYILVRVFGGKYWENDSTRDK